MPPRQTMSAVPFVFALPRCDVALYETALGNTIGSLVWSAKQMDGLKVNERFDEFEHFSTGIPFPTKHHLSSRHEITFDAIWNVPAKMARNTEYILAITWQDATLRTATESWVRRYYGGVMTSGRDISSRGGNEFTSSNMLSAKFYNETTETNAGSAPVITIGTPIC